MIRTQVCQEIARILAASGVTGDADVSPFYPGDKHQTREMIFCDSTAGNITFPYGMAPPRIQRDDFTATWVVRIQAMPTLADAMVRRDELAALVVAVLADGGIDGFEADGERVADTNGVDGVAVDSREGETNKGAQIAFASISVPIQTQTINEEG